MNRTDVTISAHYQDDASADAKRSFDSMQQSMHGTTREAGDMERKFRELEATNARLVERNRKLEQSLKDVANKGNLLGRTFGSLQGLIAGYLTIETIRRTVAFAFEVSQLAARADTMRRAYQRMAQERGVNPAVLMHQIAEATRGTRSEVDKLIIANTALSSGIEPLYKNLGQIIRDTMSISTGLGRNAAADIERVVSAINKQEQELLDELGIVARVEVAYKQYGERLGIAASKLTQLQQREAFAILVMDQLREKAEAMGNPIDKAADSVSRLGAAWDDLRVAIGREIETGPIMGFTSHLMTAVAGMLNYRALIRSAPPMGPIWKPARSLEPGPTDRPAPETISTFQMAITRPATAEQNMERLLDLVNELPETFSTTIDDVKDSWLAADDAAKGSIISEHTIERWRAEATKRQLDRERTAQDFRADWLTKETMLLQEQLETQRQFANVLERVSPRLAMAVTGIGKLKSALEDYQDASLKAAEESRITGMEVATALSSSSILTAISGVMDLLNVAANAQDRYQRSLLRVALALQAASQESDSFARSMGVETTREMLTFQEHALSPLRQMFENIRASMPDATLVQQMEAYFQALTFPELDQVRQRRVEFLVGQGAELGVVLQSMGLMNQELADALQQSGTTYTQMLSLLRAGFGENVELMDVARQIFGVSEALLSLDESAAKTSVTTSDAARAIRLHYDVEEMALRREAQARLTTGSPLHEQAIVFRDLNEAIDALNARESAEMRRGDTGAAVASRPVVVAGVTPGATAVSGGGTSGVSDPFEFWRFDLSAWNEAIDISHAEKIRVYYGDVFDLRRVEPTHWGGVVSTEHLRGESKRIRAYYGDVFDLRRVEPTHWGGVVSTEHLQGESKRIRAYYGDVFDLRRVEPTHWGGVVSTQYLTEAARIQRRYEDVFSFSRITISYRDLFDLAPSGRIQVGFFDVLDWTSPIIRTAYGLSPPPFTLAPSRLFQVAGAKIKIPLESIIDLSGLDDLLSDRITRLTRDRVLGQLAAGAF